MIQRTTRELPITFLGDICLAAPARWSPDALGNHPLFESLAPALSDRTMLVGNLECSLSDRGQPNPLKYATLRASPDAVTRLNGLDVAILANNHVGDYGDVAAQDTVRHLEANDIKTVGYGADLQSAMEPLILERDGVSVGLLAYCCPTTNPDFLATPLDAGVAPLTVRFLRDGIRALRDRVDGLAVYLHWGAERRRFPVADQVRIARRAIDWGADAVIGCHAHVIQSYETYGGRPIFYGLGNYFFPDVEWSELHPNGTTTRGIAVQEKAARDSLAVQLTFRPGEASSRVTVQSITPLTFDSAYVTQPTPTPELRRDLDSLNRRTRLFEQLRWRRLRGDHELALKSVHRGASLVHYYATDTIEVLERWQRWRLRLRRRFGVSGR